MAEIRDSVLDENSGEELVCSLMKDVVEEATELMINKHLDRVAIPYTVRCVTREMMDFIHCAFVGQDRGDVRTDGWMGGRNPNAIAVDSWARGAVDVKVKPRVNNATGPLGHTRLSRAEDSLLGATRRSAPKGSNVGEKKNTKFDQQRGDSQESSRNHHAEGALGGRSKSVVNIGALKKKAGGAKKGDTDPNASSEGAEGSDDGNGVQQSQEEVDYTNKVKAELKKRQETKQLSDRLSKQMEDMKNVKDIVVDGTTGRVIAVKQFDGRAAAASDKGSRKAEMKFQVAPDAEAPVSRAQPTIRRAIPGMGGGQRKRGDGSAFVQEENQHGPMIEGVMPSGGVVVKEGDATRRQDLKVPKTKLTRAEYKKMVDTIQINIDPEDPVEAEGGEKKDATKVAGKAKVNDNPNVQSLPPKDGKAESMRRHSGANNNVQQQAEFKSQKAAKLPAHNISSPKKGGGMLGAGTKQHHGKDLALTANVKQRAIATVHDLEGRQRASNIPMVIHQESYFEDEDDEQS